LAQSNYTVVCIIDEEILKVSKKILGIYIRMFTSMEIDKFKTTNSCDSLINNFLSYSLKSLAYTVGNDIRNLKITDVTYPVFNHLESLCLNMFALKLST
jgi:hypothetical protein